MKRHIGLFSILVPFLALSCQTSQEQPPIVGTWELISATTQEKDTSFSTFDSTRKMIKIINPTHFAFLNHALKGQKEFPPGTPFSAGGGAYTLADSLYTEHLEYCSDPAWENHSFEFVVEIRNDTLTQKGVEKIAELGIERVIVEKYKRVEAAAL